MFAISLKSALPSVCNIMCILNRLQVLAISILLQWTLTNPNSLGSEIIQISESFGLVNECIMKGEWLYFYSIPLKIAMDIINLTLWLTLWSQGGHYTEVLLY